MSKVCLFKVFENQSQGTLKLELVLMTHQVGVLLYVGVSVLAWRVTHLQVTSH